jgi:glycosyltransferase involved in cell wall biosynthesis
MAETITPKPVISIVVPVYNEDQTIEAVLRMLLGVDFGQFNREVIVVDDGSVDKTRQVLGRFHNSEGVKVVYRTINGGKGAAVRDGIQTATGRVVIIQDADLEYDPNEIPMLVKPILAGEAKVVYGSRFLGRIRHMTIMRRFANRLLAWYINVLFGSTITDACTCYKAFDADVMRSFHLQSDGFEICHEITAKTLKTGYRIMELPITYRARSTDEGIKSSWKDFVRQLGYILMFRFRNSPGK